MSYEQKIKDLMARLASMSPEPPPYPEETPMARPQTKRRPRPAFVFATAAALVALLAVPLLLFDGEQDPVVVGTTTTSTTVPSTTTTTTAPPTTTTTSEPGTTTTAPVEGSLWQGVVFVYQTPEDSFVGNPALVPLNIEVSAPAGTFGDHSQFDGVLSLLAANGVGLPEPFATAIPPEVRVVTWSQEGEIVRPDMNEAFLAGAGGLLADMTMLNQLVYNLTWMNEGASVLFTVGNEPIEMFGSEGLVLTDPVGRESFLDHLHTINLTSPILPGADGAYVVEGIANVFEATLNVAVLDGAGEVVHEQFVSATCGTGCWGDFSASIDADLITPGESSVLVFTSSAEDGSPIDVITVPIPEGDVWNFTLED